MAADGACSLMSSLAASLWRRSASSSDGGTTPLLQRRATSSSACSVNPLARRRQRPAVCDDCWAATGRERGNLRAVLAGPAGSITRFKMLLLGEQLHQAALQHHFEASCDVGEPAWEQDYGAPMCGVMGEHVRRRLFWCVACTGEVGCCC